MEDEGTRGQGDKGDKGDKGDRGAGEPVRSWGFPKWSIWRGMGEKFLSPAPCVPCAPCAPCAPCSPIPPCSRTAPLSPSLSPTGDACDTLFLYGLK
ncbi:MAG: hypothetical protein KME31_37940 [Tolypothrix carrinoi HA7290-LM1]|nr:hypothetical protein [Tolypothrix carrinoi HA7290-LM1]